MFSTKSEIQNFFGENRKFFCKDRKQKIFGGTFIGSSPALISFFLFSYGKDKDRSWLKLRKKYENDYKEAFSYAQHLKDGQNTQQLHHRYLIMLCRSKTNLPVNQAQNTLVYPFYVLQKNPE